MSDPLASGGDPESSQVVSLEYATQSIATRHPTNLALRIYTSERKGQRGVIVTESIATESKISRDHPTSE
jgi:hypothetical protein